VSPFLDYLVLSADARRRLERMADLRSKPARLNRFGDVGTVAYGVTSRLCSSRFTRLSSVAAVAMLSNMLDAIGDRQGWLVTVGRTAARG
jgi:hypothetical protein